MELPDVLNVLGKLPHPFTDTLATYRDIPNSLKIRFHGMSLGKMLAGVQRLGYAKNSKGFYCERGGSTFAATSLDYAMDIARKRTDPNIKENGEWGGRFNPVTGEREEGYGVPVVLAIDTEFYVKKGLIDAKHCLMAVQIYGRIDLTDIVILFDHMEDHFPYFVDQASLAESSFYNILKGRFQEAAPFDSTRLSKYQLDVLTKNLMLE